MTIRSRLSRSRALTVATGGIIAGLAVAGGAGALVIHPATSSTATGTAAAHPATTAADPYFLCVAYQMQWGVCIGPPTS